MRLPVIQGVIDRRILVNYRIDPDVLAGVLPPPFRPQLVRGEAIGGICLIRLKRLRPRWLPLPLGLGSENAAHRFAVEWESGGAIRPGVYIPRRDTDSWLNAWVGGRLFPGVHHHARFTVDESADQLSVAMRSDDEVTHLQVEGTRSAQLPEDSVFASVTEASEFFELGSLGYSDTRKAGLFDGLELRTQNWHVEPFEVDAVATSYFDDPQRFPEGSVTFDHALLMRGIRHTWHSRDRLVCPPDQS